MAVGSSELPRLRRVEAAILPRAELGAEPDEGTLVWLGHDPDDPRDDWPHQRILVVERDPALSRLLCIGLRSRGWIAHPMTPEGWSPDHVRDNDYALVLVDLRPNPADETLLLHTLAARPGQRVMVMSDTQDKEWTVRCFNAGVVDYLGKPFALVELLARIQTRLRPPALAEPRSEQLLHRGGLTIDVSRRTADCGRGPVKLSNREFVLLEYLMTNEGQVCGREELLSAAWGLSDASSTNLVEAYVRRIRVKLGGGVIATVHRKGYVFVGANRTAGHVRVRAVAE
jgi:two-component system OmpR family response regulator